MADEFDGTRYIAIVSEFNEKEFNDFDDFDELKSLKSIQWYRFNVFNELNLMIQWVLVNTPTQDPELNALHPHPTPDPPEINALHPHNLPPIQWT